jgi:predicted nucleic acid-binding protein
MKIFIDANVIIAVLNREYPLFTWASRVLSLQGKNNITLFTSPLCLAIAFYFSGKKSGEKLAKKKIELFCRNMPITTIDEKITTQAISNPQVHDFEDGLEYYSAVQENCNFIVTENPEDFYFSEIEVIRCEEFLKRLRHDK